MDEYISRVAVLEHLNKCKEDPFFDPDMARICFSISIFIENMPAADVQPVVHAEWVCHEPEIGLYYSCSRCGHNALQGMYKFCPNCSAKMDGDAE